MKKYLIILAFLALFTSLSNAQDLKRVHPVYVEINNKNPDKAVYTYDDISIKFLNIENGLLKIEIENLSDKNVEFVRKKSYTVVDGHSEDTYIGFERTNAATYQKNILVPKKTKVTSTLYLGKMFDFNSTKKYWKQHNTAKHNKLILTFDADSKEKEIEFDVAVYLKKNK